MVFVSSFHGYMQSKQHFIYDVKTSISMEQKGSKYKKKGDENIWAFVTL